MKTSISVNQRSLRLVLLSALAFASALAAVNGQAAQTTTSFTVSATVTASCTLTAGDLLFGDTVDVLSATATTAQGTLTATCTAGSDYTIGLNGGASTGATVTARAMTHTGDPGEGNTAQTLGYSLSTVAPGGINWDDIGGTTVYHGTGDGTAQSIPVFGQIPTGQTTPTAGAYSDTITATIDF